MREIIDTEAPEGYEVEEVSRAKNEVMDLFEWRGDLFDFEYDSVLGDTRAVVKDSIETADAIVELLLKIGWRPTKEAVE